MLLGSLGFTNSSIDISARFAGIEGTNRNVISNTNASFVTQLEATKVVQFLWFNADAIPPEGLAVFTQEPIGVASTKQVLSVENGNLAWNVTDDGSGAGSQTRTVSDSTGFSASTWYHVILRWDTTQATASERMKIYVNGSAANNSGSNLPAQNAKIDVNDNGAIAYMYYGTGAVLGSGSGSVHNNFDGLIHQAGIVTGVIPDNSSFYNSGYVATDNIVGTSGLRSLIACRNTVKFDATQQSTWNKARVLGDVQLSTELPN